MTYKPRHIEPRCVEYAKYYKVVLILGARQVGKSTLLKHLFPDYKMIVFDPLQDIYHARQDPDLFLDNFPSPIILDEIQYVPELLPAIKRRVDLESKNGQYILTGSQNLSMLKSIAESMAGRVGILHLEALTTREMVGMGANGGWLNEYLANLEVSPELFRTHKLPIEHIALHLWRGFLPGLLDLPDTLVPGYFQSYINTYVERDIRLIENIQDIATFGRFLGLLGALTAQEINASQLGRDIGISPLTARKWLDGLLSNTYQWLELPPYSADTDKRISGKKKGYLRDTGMASNLQRISSPDALAVSPLLGPLFESWAINNIYRQFVNLPVPPYAYHWRTLGGAEVDLILERNGNLYPIEMKCKTNLTKHDTSGLKAFRETYEGSSKIGTGLIIYAGNECYKIDSTTIAVPWNYI